MREGCSANGERFVFNGKLYSFLGVSAANIPVSGEIIPDWLRYAARVNFTISDVMYSIDWKWQEAFCDRQACDGVVRMNSQQYVSADAEQVINNANSHVGSTKSTLVTRELSEIALLARR